MTPRVLIVDGNEADRATLVGMLGGDGYELDEAPDGIEAFEKLLAQPYDLVVTEAKLDRLDGPDLIAKLRGHGVKTPVVVLTSVTKAATLASLMKLGITAYVHKATPPDVVRQKIAAALPAGPAQDATETRNAAASNQTGGQARPEPGGILIVDGLELEHERLRALVPAAIAVDGCKTFNEAMARARSGHYRMLLLDSDATVLNLGGVVAQMHVLQPDAIVAGMATVGKNDERAAVGDSLDALGFDAVVFKPFAPAEIALLVEQYCASWDDLVSASDDLIVVSRLRCRRGHDKRYLPELGARIEAALSPLSDACFDRAILDLTRVEHLAPADMAELLARVDRAAHALGVTLLVAATDRVRAGLENFTDIFVREPLRCFPSATAARAAVG